MVATEREGRTEERERDAGRADWHEDWRALKAFSPFVENSQDRLQENEVDALLDARGSRRAADRHVDIRIRVDLPDLQRAVHDDIVSRAISPRISRSCLRPFVCLFLDTNTGTPRPYRSFYAGSLTRSRTRWAPAGPSRDTRNPPPPAIVSRPSNDFLIWSSWSPLPPPVPCGGKGERAEISSRIRSSYLAGKPPSRRGRHAIGLARCQAIVVLGILLLHLCSNALLLMAIKSQRHFAITDDDVIGRLMVPAHLEESARFQVLSVHPVGRRDHHDMVVRQHLQSRPVDGMLRRRYLRRV